MGIFGKKPDTAGIAAAQKKAAEQERLKIAQEAAEKAASDRRAESMMAEKTESKRRAFAGQLTPAGDETERKRFLKGV